MSVQSSGFQETINGIDINIPSNILKEGRQSLKDVSTALNSIDVTMIGSNITVSGFQIGNGNAYNNGIQKASLNAIVGTSQNLPTNAIDITINSDNNIFNNTDNVTLEFNNVYSIYLNSYALDLQCIFYDENTQLWSDKGCFTSLSDDETKVVCRC